MSGAVHRATAIAVFSITAIGLALLAVGTAVERRELRVGRAALFLLPGLLIPLAQVIPLAPSVRKVFDPDGSALLSDLISAGSAFPLSLDPVVTRSYIGKAAAALAFFIVAYHLGSGQRHRYLVPRAVGAAAIAAVTIGISHKVMGVSKIYGLLTSTHRTLLVGPFVNANHTAELLELGAFVCLACSFQRPTMLNRACWLIGMSLCAGGVAATLSRGGIAALGAGALAFVVLRSYSEGESGRPRRKRVALLGGALLAGVLILSVAALGSGQLVERFRSGSITSDIRFTIWRNSLRVLAAHPFGIGRGAFDRVFPIYKTVRTPFALRFAFVENEPLQLLIDCGWAFYALLLLCFGLLLWDLARHARRDRIEAALVAGLLAVFVHNLVDFGLETPGILLPFMGIFATVLARAYHTPLASVWGRRLVVGAAVAGCLAGAAAIAHPSADDFDTQLRQARTPAARKAVLERARRAHPVDYFYVLASAGYEPLKGPPGQPSPRFHLLNQALMLCPGCEAVHTQVAQGLWSLGLRRQALLEYRSAVEIQPQQFMQVLGHLFREGAKPEELAAIATFDPNRMIDVAHFLSTTGRLPDAVTVLGQAESLGASRVEVLLMQTDLELEEGHATDAEATLAELRALRVSDPRLATLEARTLLANSAPNAPDRALSILDAATIRDPGNVEVQRLRVDVVVRYHKWSAASRALEGYKEALYARDGMATEAHLASARIMTQMGRWTDALGEYRIALADQPTNVGLWMELGSAGEMAGRIETAREAYSTAARLSPGTADALNGLQRLDNKRRDLRDSTAPPTAGASDVEQ